MTQNTNTMKKIALIEETIKYLDEIGYRSLNPKDNFTSEYIQFEISRLNLYRANIQGLKTNKLLDILYDHSYLNTFH